MPTKVESPCTSIAEAEIRDLLDSIFQGHHEKNAADLAAPYERGAVIARCSSTGRIDSD